MNPEEGQLRPQLQDRFGLRVIVRALENDQDRLEAYHRSAAYQQNPYQFVSEWEAVTLLTAADIQAARTLLPDVKIGKKTEKTGIRWVQDLEIESQRAEITLFEAARAYAAADQRKTVRLNDLRAVAPMALRQRHSNFMTDYMKQQAEEQQQIMAVIDAK
jgi:magnesium chelatase subunit I